LQDLAAIVLKRRAMVDGHVSVRALIKLRVGDISGRDNSELAKAASAVVGAWGTLRDRGLIDDEEYMRICYKFAGEVVDVRGLLENGRAAGASGVLPQGAASGSNGSGPNGSGQPKQQTITNPITGEVAVKGA